MTSSMDYEENRESGESGLGPDGDAFSKASQDALRFLAYRARSKAEVRRRLGKSYPSGIVESVLAHLQRRGYLDDEAFARQWRWHREQRRPRGQGVIRQELLRLGVEPEVIREALADFDATDNAYRAGLTFARRLDPSDHNRFRQRLWPFLQRRGFDREVIQDVTSRLWQELADPLHGRVDAEEEEQQGKEGESEGVDRPTDDECARDGTSSDPG